MQNGYGGIDTLTVFPVLYRSFFLFSEQTPVLLDAELGFVDTLTLEALELSSVFPYAVSGFQQSHKIVDTMQPVNCFRLVSAVS